ncbi:MAG: restriction endonuclease subunit S [Acidimicrobiales bacterium]|nr:restriction endonuclease subunit S [Acidimicrobiales bacterium]
MGENWSEATLGEVAEYFNGYPFKPADLGTEGLPVIRIKQLLDEREPVDRSVVDVPERCLLGDGDLVFSWSGTLAVRIWNRGPALLNQHLFRVVERAGIDKAWLALALEDALAGLESKTHGTTMRHITKAELLPHPVLVPPMTDQRRIVDVITAIDRVVRALHRELDSAERLVAALRFELIEAPEWDRKPLDDLLTKIDGGRSPVTEGRPPAEGERGVLKLSAVRPGRFDQLETKALRDDTPMPRAALVSVGDVLITRSNTPQTVGAVCFVDRVLRETYLSDLTLRLKPGPEVQPAYLAEALNTTRSRSQIMASASGTSGSMRKISRRVITAYEIPVPPIAEQDRVLNIIGDAKNLVQSAETALRAAEQTRRSLVADLLSGTHKIPDSYDELLERAS